MQLESATFTLTLPDGWAPPSSPPDSACWAARDPDGPSELIANAMTTTSAADLEPVMVELCKVRLDAARDLWGRPLEHDQRLERGDDGRLTTVLRGRWDQAGLLHVQATRGRPFVGNYAIVSLMFIQYSPCLSLDFLEALFQPIVDGLVLLPDDAARERAERERDAPLDPASFVPYVVPRTYFEDGHDLRRVRHLGHGCYLIVAVDLGGTCRLVRPWDVAEAGIDWDDAITQARANLVTRLRDREVTIRTYEAVRGRRLLQFGPEWLAASCIDLPDLHHFASEILEASDLYVSLPHREALIIFPASDAQSIAEMVALIQENESRGRKRLTDGVFSLKPAGVTPLK